MTEQTPLQKANELYAGLASTSTQDHEHNSDFHWVDHATNSVGHAICALALVFNDAVQNKQSAKAVKVLDSLSSKIADALKIIEDRKSKAMRHQSWKAHELSVKSSKAQELRELIKDKELEQEVKKSWRRTGDVEGYIAEKLGALVTINEHINKVFRLTDIFEENCRHIQEALRERSEDSDISAYQEIAARIQPHALKIAESLHGFDQN